MLTFPGLPWLLSRATSGVRRGAWWGFREGALWGAFLGAGVGFRRRPYRSSGPFPGPWERGSLDVSFVAFSFEAYLGVRIHDVVDHVRRAESTGVGRPGAERVLVVVPARAFGESFHVIRLEVIICRV